MTYDKKAGDAAYYTANKKRINERSRNACVEELKVKRPLIYGGGAPEPPTLGAVIRDIARSEIDDA